MIRATDWNRFQDKIRKGDTQIFRLGWNADYPDPENFLFLLYGPQSRAKSQGENAANYANPEFDALFEKMKNMPNSPERQKIIDQMVEIARVDAPWIWGVHPKKYSLRHSWVANGKPNTMARNNMKYLRIDPQRRARAARRVEPAGAVAARRWSSRFWWPSACRPWRATGAASAWPRGRRENRGARCWPTSSAACCTRSRS